MEGSRGPLTAANAMLKNAPYVMAWPAGEMLHHGNDETREGMVCFVAWTEILVCLGSSVSYTIYGAIA